MNGILNSAGRAVQQEERPSPAIAALLSAVVPGLGQFYVGNLLAGLTMSVLALLSLGGMLDYLDFNYHAREELFKWGLPALTVYVLNLLFSVLHARKCAKRYSGGSPLYRAVRYYLSHARQAGTLFDTLLWPFFLYSALGIAFGWAGAAAIAENFKYWFFFELTGTLLFGFAVQMVWDLRCQFDFSRRGELIGYGICYLIFTAVWGFWLCTVQFKMKHLYRQFG